VARSRNRPPRLAALILVAVLALLAVLAARAEAAPEPGGDLDDNVDDTLSLPAPGEEVVPGAIGVSDGRSGPVRGAVLVPVPHGDLTPPIPIHDLVQATYRAAGIAGDPAPSWRTRARLTGLVPWLSVRGGRGLTWREVDDPTFGHADTFEIRATWRLDRLLFDPNEIRIAAIDVSRRRERRHVAALVSHTYYEWLALDAAARRSTRWALRETEVRAELDAMTDGWFSDALAKVTGAARGAGAPGGGALDGDAPNNQKP
jgi:hypothetical protein